MPRLHAILALALIGVYSGPAQETQGPAPPGSQSTRWWAFQSPPPVSPPRVKDAGWARTPIDLFIRAELERAGLVPNPAADKRVLFRRASFDLLGLPPEVDELEAFVTDDAPDAWARLIEQWLASPRYGERWGRHWMDVARYADTAGDNADYPIPEIHLYRDYIIDAFNADVPFDRFVREQLAGDILARQAASERYPEQVAATGFLALSRRYGTGPYELWHLTMENTLETVGLAFMGLNLKCARCHDHKFDPITTRDYYGLYGIFAGTQFPWAGSEEIQSKKLNRQKFASLLPDDRAAPLERAWQERMRRLREEIAALEQRKDERDHAKLDKLREALRSLEKPGAPPDLPVAYAVQEGTPREEPVHGRGDPASPGEPAPRCPPRFLLDPATGFAIPEGSSGRLALADWLVRADHPLTARVLVNRVWLHHFGAGLVSTPNHFGKGGEEPVHRALLDWLARRFVAEGWSIKNLHRLILHSAVYQLSSEVRPANRERDPENRLLWRQPRRRLEAEALRDALLAVGGALDFNRPGPHPFPPPERWIWTQHTPFKDIYDSNHRSVYMMTQRFQKHPFLGLFDGPDANSSTGSRQASIVPQQALYALNSPFADAQAAGLAKRVTAFDGDEDSRIERMHAIAWGRPPSIEETECCRRWLARARQASTDEDAWHALARVFITANEFYYVD